MTGLLSCVSVLRPVLLRSCHFIHKIFRSCGPVTSGPVNNCCFPLREFRSCVRSCHFRSCYKFVFSSKVVSVLCPILRSCYRTLVSFSDTRWQYYSVTRSGPVAGPVGAPKVKDSPPSCFLMNGMNLCEIGQLLNSVKFEYWHFS